MREIDIQLQERYKDSFFQALKEEFRVGNIQIREIPEEEMTIEVREKGHTLILTDQKRTAAWAKREDIACVAYEALDAEYHFTGVDMVIQGFEQLNAEFFALVFKRHYGLPWHIAETERILLRESMSEDFEGIYAIYQEPGMTDYMAGISGTKEEERQFLDTYIQRMYPFFGYGLWTVVEKESASVIGRVGLENGSYQGKPVVELGYMIGKNYQHKGYAREAVLAALGYGTTVIEAGEIYAFVDEQNEKSLRLIKQLEFEEIEPDRQGIRAFRYRTEHPTKSL